MLLQDLLDDVGLGLLLDLMIRLEGCARRCSRSNQIASIIHLLDVGHHADNVVEVVLPDSW